MYIFLHEDGRTADENRLRRRKSLALNVIKYILQTNAKICKFKACGYFPLVNMLSVPFDRHISFTQVSKDRSLLLLLGTRMRESLLHNSRARGCTWTGWMELGRGEPLFSVRCAVSLSGLFIRVILQFSWCLLAKQFHDRVLFDTQFKTRIVKHNSQFERRM
jgi:hypothetical protein